MIKLLKRRLSSSFSSSSSSTLSSSWKNVINNNDNSSLQPFMREFFQCPLVQRFGFLVSLTQEETARLIERVAGEDGHFGFLVRMREDIQTCSTAKELSSQRRESLLSMDNRLRKFLRQNTRDSDLTVSQAKPSSPAPLLQFIMDREAVHPFMAGLDDVRARTCNGRLIYCLNHQKLNPLEPVAFVNVALTNVIASSVRPLLSDEPPTSGSVVVDETEKPKIAMFYSISNSCPGMLGTDLGNILLKRVIKQLKRDIPSVTQYCTLSPIPKFRHWLLHNYKHQNPGSSNTRTLVNECKRYLLEAKNAEGFAYDPVEHFHLRNGASFLAVHGDASQGARFQEESFGIMANYLYDVDRLALNAERYQKQKIIATSTDRSKI